MFTPTEDLKKIEAPEKCACSAGLPWHLVEVAEVRFNHTCSCGLSYQWRDGGLVCVGASEAKGLTRLEVIR
jgi:hypothetical protein